MCEEELDSGEDGLVLEVVSVIASVCLHFSKSM